MMPSWVPAHVLSGNICASHGRSQRKMAEDKSKIVIIGGRFGGLFTAFDLVGTGEITLVLEEDHFLFRPMLYEYLSGEVEAWHIAPDCKELLNDQAKFIRDAVTNIDLDSQTVAFER